MFCRENFDVDVLTMVVVVDEGCRDLDHDICIVRTRQQVPVVGLEWSGITAKYRNNEEPDSAHKISASRRVSRELEIFEAAEGVIVVVDNLAGNCKCLVRRNSEKVVHALELLDVAKHVFSEGYIDRFCQGNRGRRISRTPPYRKVYQAESLMETFVESVDAVVSERAAALRSDSPFQDRCRRRALSSYVIAVLVNRLAADCVS